MFEVLFVVLLDKRRERFEARQNVVTYGESDLRGRLKGGREGDAEELGRAIGC